MASAAAVVGKKVNARMKFIGVVSDSHTYRILFYMHIDALINELKLERDLEENEIKINHGLPRW